MYVCPKVKYQNDATCDVENMINQKWSIKNNNLIDMCYPVLSETDNTDSYIFDKVLHKLLALHKFWIITIMTIYLFNQLKNVHYYGH